MVHSTSYHIKGEIYRACVQSVLTYGTETQGRNHASIVEGPNQAKPELLSRSAQDLKAKSGRGVKRGGTLSPSPENFWYYEL